MKQFNGFPARTEFTPVPNAFFSSLLSEIDSLAELKTTLYVIAALYKKKGYPRFVSYSEMLGNNDLIRSLKTGEESPEEVLKRSLKAAAGRGTLLHLALDKDGTSEDVYFLNDEPGRQAVGKIESGELVLDGLKTSKKLTVVTEKMPDIFTLYEQNIGMLTPLIADELKDAENRYPQNWIQDAIKEAALNNKRSIKYIAKILERWSTEGRIDGAYQRDSKKTDPDKYVKGKYGHMVRR